MERILELNVIQESIGKLNAKMQELVKLLEQREGVYDIEHITIGNKMYIKIEKNLSIVFEYAVEDFEEKVNQRLNEIDKLINFKSKQNTK